MRSSVRTFVAVPVAPELEQRAGVLIQRLRGTEAQVKWVEPNNLHWTLKFLGDIELRETAAVCQAVSEAVAPFEPFDIEALGAGAFPSIERPRTVWLGMGQGSDEMVALYDAIDQALRPLGFRSEPRRFRPHITIGRVRQSTPEGITDLGNLLQQHADFEGGIASVYEVAIFASVLGRHGPTYEPLGHAELGRDA
jgi:2'-5' RNA ligase